MSDSDEQNEFESLPLLDELRQVRRLSLERAMDAVAGSHSGYEILRELRRGGQGIVYEAIQRSTGRRDALKVLLHGGFRSDGEMQRFAREVELLASLHHRSIVTLFDTGEINGEPYYAMESGERGPWSDPVQHTITTPTPVAPVILGPIGPVTTGPLIVDWDAVRFAACCSVFLRRIDRRAPDVVVHDIKGLSWSPTGTLNNGDYQVWVRAWTEAGVFIPWCDPRGFTVNEPIPGQVTLLGPTGTISTQTPVFSWQPVAHADRYILWLTNLDTNQHPVLLESNINENEFTPANPLPAGSYRFWI